MSLTHRRGFSLIELSMVIAIIALVLGFGLGMGSNAMRAADHVSAQQRMLTIQAALESFVKANGFLPCPASMADRPKNEAAMFGVERRLGTLCSGGQMWLSNNVYIGMVPVRTLGLPDSYAGDPWGNKIVYAVSAPHVSNPSNYMMNDGAITVSTGDRYGVHYPVTSHVDRTAMPLVPNTAAKIAYGAGATYVVVSLGPDGKGAFPIRGTTQPIACGTATNHENDLENCDINDVFWDTAYNDNPTQTDQYFDDFIVWGSNPSRVPLSQTFVAACSGTTCENWCAPCAGATPNIPNNPGTSALLCSKIITSTAPCAATCVWSTANTRCP